MVGNTCGVRYCPSNCDCSSEFWSTCEILYCDDDLDIETAFLTIIGKLCPRHYVRSNLAIHLLDTPLQYGSPYGGPAYLRGYISQYAPCIGAEIATESIGDRV